MTREFLQQSLDNQYYIELHLLVSLIVSHGLRGYMHAILGSQCGLKSLAGKLPKHLARGYIRIEHFLVI